MSTPSKLMTAEVQAQAERSGTHSFSSSIVQREDDGIEQWIVDS